MHVCDLHVEGGDQHRAGNDRHNAAAASDAHREMDGLHSDYRNLFGNYVLRPIEKTIDNQPSTALVSTATFPSPGRIT